MPDEASQDCLERQDQFMNLSIRNSQWWLYCQKWWHHSSSSDLTASSKNLKEKQNFATLCIWHHQTDELSNNKQIANLEKKEMNNQCQPLISCLKLPFLHNSALHSVESTSYKILLLKYPRYDAVSWIHTTTELIRLEWSPSVNC